MKINQANALRLWEEYYGDSDFAVDFHGNLMYRDAYGKKNYYVKDKQQKIYCGWNLHHILPKRLGGKTRRRILFVPILRPTRLRLIKSLIG